MCYYSVLKSAANAVLKFISVVIPIAHVLSVKIKSLSTSFMLYSFGKLKYDSITLTMFGSLGPSSVSASRLPVFRAIFNFLLKLF